MSRIFIDRPIFAWVIAIIIMLIGLGAIFALPVSQYPDVAPTQINIRATYPGANAQTIENSVTQILERQLTGLDGMLYFQSSSTSRGQVTITAVFDKGVDPDIAHVQVQNKGSQAISRLPQTVQTPDQFRNIIVKSESSGARVLLGDVARVELGADNYSALIRANGHPGAGMGVSLEPGANALRTAELVKAKVADIAKRMPPGFKVAYAFDTTDFIKLSIQEVVKTLVEAMILVILVMFVFLQNWRALLIPSIAIPIVLLGTFGVLYMLGFSINTMTLFGLVLAIGLLVDDAIVVVENVERLLDENPQMSPRDATIIGMSQIQMALVAIALVLSAVFLPMVFFGGSTGVIYRQFSATIVSAMVLSVFIAMTLSPAIAANLLHRNHGSVEGTWLGRKLPRVAHWLEVARQKFNAGFDHTRNWYVGSVSTVVDRQWLFLAIYVGVFVLLILMFYRLPTRFLPSEDQGAAFVQFRLPAGATQARTLDVQQRIENYFLRGPEKK